MLASGFFAQDGFSGLGGGDGDLGVRIARRADVDRVDVVAGDDFTPVGRVLCEPELVGGVAHRALVAPADDLQHRLAREFEEVPSLSPRIAVRAAHELIADHRDAKRFHLNLLWDAF